MKSKKPEKKKFSLKKLYASVGLFLVIASVTLASFTSYEWSAYARNLGDKDNHVIYLGGFTSESGCKKYAVKKISDGVSFSRFEQANSYFCGKYCFELSFGQGLKRSNVICMMEREN